MHGRLRPRIAIDRDIGSPQIAPGGAVLREQKRRNRLCAHRLRGRIGLAIASPVLARGRDEFGEGICFVFL